MSTGAREDLDEVLFAADASKMWKLTNANKYKK